MKSIVRKASVSWKNEANGRAKVTTMRVGLLPRTHRFSGSMLNKGFATDSAELIAAAHAGSFSLALSKELRRIASASGEFVISAAATVEHLAAGWTVTNVHLNVVAKLAKVTQDQFIDATVRAKTSCLVSRLLRANVSMNAKLEK